MPHQNSAVSKFVETVNSIFKVGDLSTFWDCKEAFSRLLGSSFVRHLLNSELQQLAADPDYVGDWQPKHVMVHRGARFSLALSLFDSSRRYGYIHTIPYYAMYAPIGALGLDYDRYSLPKGYRNDVFDPSQQLIKVNSAHLKPRDILQIHPDREVYDFKLAAPVLVARFTTSPIHPLEWLFSKETLHPWQANDSEISSTQLRVAAYVLGKLAHPSSLDPLNQLTTHHHHSVRWAAIQSLGRVSRNAVIEKLKIAVNDSHPHVRQAAEKTLRQLTEKVVS